MTNEVALNITLFSHTKLFLPGPVSLTSACSFCFVYLDGKELFFTF